MKIACLQEKLEAAVTQVERVTGKNLTLPVLRCILFEAQGSTLTLRATNLEIGIEVRVACKVEEEGRVAVPADIMRSFLSHLNRGKTVELIAQGNSLQVTTPTTSTSINVYPHEEFPSIPHLDKAGVKLSAEALTTGLRSVIYSASPSSMKPELASIYIYPDDNSLVFAATDSFRLAEKRIKLSTNIEPMLIPYRNTAEIIRILESVEGDVELRYGENQVALITANLYLTSRTIDGVFPDYTQIIPREEPTKATLLKEDLSNTLKLSNIFSDKFNQITLSIDPAAKKFTIKTLNSDVGENIAHLDAVLEGNEVEASFNYRYITDVFTALTTDSVTLALGPGKPMVIRGVGDKSFLYLVMPTNK
jgi:DNA polymerase-3 subunit beta